MGLILKPSEVKNCTKQMRSQIESNRNSYAGVLQTVQKFAGNESFQSKSWNTLQGKVMGSHQMINRGMLTVQDSVMRDLDTMESIAVGDELDEDLLMKTIIYLEEECIRYETAIQTFLKLQTSLPQGVYSSINQYIKKCREMLEKTKEELKLVKEMLNDLYEKTEQTSELFQTIGTLLEAIECAISDAEVYISGRGTLSEESWVTVIPEMVEKIESDLHNGRTGEVPQIAGQDNLGYLSGIGESNMDAGLISQGKGDYGGKSYGAFQFASQSNTPLVFVNWLENNDKEMYNTLKNAYIQDGNAYNSNFDNAWENIADTMGDDFLLLQYQYTQYQFYDTFAEKIEKDTGFDFNEKGFTLKNVLWSRAVQHGNVMAVERALDTLDLEKASDDEIIKAIYAESGRVVSNPPSDKSIPMSGEEAKKYGLEGKYLRYFSKNSSVNQIGVWKRLTENLLHSDQPNSELDRALEMLEVYG